MIAPWGRVGAVLVAGSSVALLSSLLQGIVLARGLGAAGRGQFAAIVTLTMSAAWFSELGCGEATVYRQARTPNEAAQTLGAWLALGLALSLAAMLFAQYALGGLIGGEPAGILTAGRIYLLATVIFVLNEVVHGMLTGDQDFRFVNAMVAAQALIATMGLALLWRMHALTVPSALGVTGAAYALLTLTSGARAIRRYGIKRPSWPLLRETATYGARAHVGNLGALLNLGGAVLLLPLLVTTSDVGLYAVAATGLSAVTSMASGLGAVVLSLSAAQSGRAQAILNSWLAATLVAASLVSALLFLVAEWLLPALYGAAYNASVTPFRILLPGVVMWTGALVVGAALKARGQPLLFGYAQVPGLVIMAIGLLVFAPRGGISAAAAVSTTAYTVVFFVTLALARARWRSP